ncbi:MAG: hypothetical protein M3Y44_00715 [Actinomycetota bacterium]|nr:hypothetical protein [Actinomycetota bacterium]
MSSSLAGIAIERRRRFAATLGLFAALFSAVGVVGATGTSSTPGAVRVFSAIALVVAMLLGLMAWGVARSVRLDRAEQGLNTAIDEALAARGQADGDPACGCGHDHDADEMHVTGQACAHDGTGVECAHSCDTCVLAALRPSPTRSRAERVAEQSVPDRIVQG